MTTKTITGAYPGGYTLNTAFYGLDITTSASVGGTGVLVTRTGAVTNYGTVAATTGTHDGVYMQNGGTVINGGASQSAHISGDIGIQIQTAGGISPVWSSVVNHGYVGGSYAGVAIAINGQLSNYATVHGSTYGFVAGGSSTLRNFGIVSGGSFGASINGGGTRIYNGSATNSSALIQGVVGVVAVYAEAYVTNDATISGTSRGVYLRGGARLTNGGAAGVGLVKGASGVFANAPGSFVFNYATITGSGGAGHYGVKLAGGAGELKNFAGAEVYGFSGATITGYGQVRNYGLIAGEGGVDGAYGIKFAAGGRLYNNKPYGAQSAEIGGYAAVSFGTGPGYVINSGFIVSSGLHTAGISMQSGTVLNGTLQEKAAYIAGANGLDIGDTGDVLNFGTIRGSLSTGLQMGGGVVTNGSAKDEAALIEGADGGLLVATTSSVTNFGTIRGGAAFGVYAYGGGSLTNGSAKDQTALIIGFPGVVSKEAPETVKNFGTISGYSGYGVYLLGGGSLTNGTASDLTASITGGEGVRLGGGASGVNFGTITSTNGYGAVLGLSDNLTNGSANDTKAFVGGSSGVYVYGADTVINFGTIAGTSGNAVEFQDNYATLVVEASSTFIGAVYGDGGTIDLASGVGKITGLFNGGDLTVSGSMAATTFTGFGTLEIGAGAQFTDKGLVSITAGQTAEASGTLTLGGSGRDGVINGGLLEAFTGGTMALLGAVTNTGTLETHGGTLSTTGAVSGAGVAVIAGGTLDMGAAFMENVTFSGGGGVLELARSRTYTGTVTGFSKTGTTSFDLLDVGFVSSTEATYSGTKTGGVLTVSDGTTTAHITLVGNYLSSTWVASSDGHGGVSVVDPPAQAPASSATPSLHSFVAAMAGLGSPPVAQGVRVDHAWSSSGLALANPRGAVA
jgi:hypothetical protein